MTKHEWKKDFLGRVNTTANYYSTTAVINKSTRPGLQDVYVVFLTGEWHT